MNLKSREDKALDFLALEQQSNGGYLSYSSPRKWPFTPRHTYQTTFVPSLILSALSRVDNPKSQTLRNQLAAFLLAKRSAHWSYNYWSGEEETRERPLPDDLDDTFCALSSLWLHDPALIDETALAHIVKILLAAESEVGGPYRTWLVPKSSPQIWRDVDLAVNANVAHFLSLAVNPLPNLTDLLEQAIQTSTFASPYYPDEYPIMYFIARSYNGPQQHSFAENLRSKQLADGGWGSPLNTALAISSLHFLSQRIPDKAIRALCNYQNSDGSWPAEGFCIDPTREQMTFFNGSPSLTTALALEAITLFKKQQLPAASKGKTVPRLITEVRARALASTENLDPSIKEILLPALTQTLKGKNAQEIILLPQLFFEGLVQKTDLPPDTFTDLALANLLGWTAYTIYDDILDGDKSSSALPAANVAMRQSLILFDQVIHDMPNFRSHVQTVFDAMDSANAWEVAQSRFKVEDKKITIGHPPDYLELDRLAERSLGHTLTPTGILAACGIGPELPEARSIHNALRHYLIARQLNDDAHDWQEDLKVGHISYVVARVLRQLNIRPGTYDLQTVLSMAEQQFWHHTVRDICYKITRHTTLSRKLLSQSNLLIDSNIIAKLLDDTDASVARTFKTVDQAKQFLKAYNDET